MAPVSVHPLWRPALRRKLSWRTKGTMLLLRNIFEVHFYSVQWPQGFFSASERTYANIHWDLNRRYAQLAWSSLGLCLGWEVSVHCKPLRKSRNLALGILVLLSGYHQGPIWGLEMSDVCLCTQARHSLRFRIFAAFLGSTVLSLGLSAFGPTTLQTWDLSNTFKKNLHLSVGLVSALGRLFNVSYNSWILMAIINNKSLAQGDCRFNQYLYS